MTADERIRFTWGDPVIVTAQRCGSAVHSFSRNGFHMLSYDVVEWGKPLEKTERETPAPKGSEVLLELSIVACATATCISGRLFLTWAAANDCL